MDIRFVPLPADCHCETASRCKKEDGVLFGPKQGSAHFVLLLIMAIIAALFVYVGKSERGFRLSEAVPREKARQIRFWPEVKVHKSNVNTSGVEFSTSDKPTKRNRLSEYYPDTRVSR